jgi:thiosulfate/3-mercaptopyruvate sulfurtransferase
MALAPFCFGSSEEKGGENIMVKKVLIAAIVLLALPMISSQGFASVGTIFLKSHPRNIPSIVSTNWLKDNLNSKNLVVLDVRKPELHSASHIPGAINVPEGEWYVNHPFTVPFSTPWMELPPEEELFELVGDAGISSDSHVVVVGSTSGSLNPMTPLALYGVAGTDRATVTLLYAGVRNVAILDGGYEKWVADGYSTESGTVTSTPVTYMGEVDEPMFVSTEYVENEIGESVIVDARDPEVYCGYVHEPWNTQDGHIPTAKNLPTPKLLNIKEDGAGNAVYITYKKIDTLKEMVSNAVGNNENKEIIVYCGVGGYSSAAYFLLSEMLGYPKVKIYDGSAQEWTWQKKPVKKC